MINEPFRYDGARVLIVGGSTGMGAAAAHAVTRLGGEVVVIDRVPVDFPVSGFITADLSDAASIDAALASLEGQFTAVFSAAGIAGGPALMRVNFIGHRHLLERLVASGQLARGGAICLISSVAGLGWQTNLPMVLDFLSTSTYQEADEWVTAHEGSNTYTFSKQAINTYVASQAYPLMSKGIRINAICPGPTDTPLAQANSWLGFGQDYREATGAAGLRPEQMADVMCFLNSDAASGISGVSLLVDSGHVMSSTVGSYAPGKPMIDFLTNSLP